MAGLTNFYNDKHWSFIFVTWNELNGQVIEVAENNRGIYRSILKEDAVKIPDNIEYVWFRTEVCKETYTYHYSFDGEHWFEIPVEFDVAILSDDYVAETHGVFFTGAFVGLAAVDYAGYDTFAEFDYFNYQELEEPTDNTN